MERIKSSDHSDYAMCILLSNRCSSCQGKKIKPDYLCAKVIMRTPTVNKAKIEKLKFKLLPVHSDQSNGQRIYVTESCQVKTFSVL